MAVFGVPLFDTGKAGSNAKTTTAQYNPVYLSDEHTYSLANTTTNYVVGVCTSEQTSDTESIGVARAGKYKVKCAVSVTAGELLYANGSGLGAKSAAFAATTTSLGAFGQALENGSTNTVIACFLYS